MPDLGPAAEAALGDGVAEAERMCLCTMCPAYPKEDLGEKRAYCLRGDSPHKEKIDPSDCLCEGCEVYKHGGLLGRNFFCLTGAALTQGLANLAKGKPITQLAHQRLRLAPATFVGAGFDVHQRESAGSDAPTYPLGNEAPPRTVKEQKEKGNERRARSPDG